MRELGVDRYALLASYAEVVPEGFGSPRVRYAPDKMGQAGRGLGALDRCSEHGKGRGWK